MANEKTTDKAVKDPNEDRVEVFVPKTYAGDDENLYVCINDREFLLPKGETSMVPLYVKKAIERSQRAQSIQDKRSSKLAAQANQPK